MADVVAPHLTTMFNCVKDVQTLTSTLLTANIMMIPKPDWDHSSRANLNSFLLRLIKRDQMGFVPRKQAGDAISRLLQIQHIVHS